MFGHSGTDNVVDFENASLFSHNKSKSANHAQEPCLQSASTHFNSPVSDIYHRHFMLLLQLHRQIYTAPSLVLCIQLECAINSPI